jgi:murein DD-endopeptidase MepM/ murein hydrolase activator NlpD
LRTRLTLILTIAAVLVTAVLAGPADAASSPSAASGRHGWFSSVTVGIEQRVELVARLQAARGQRFAQVADALTTPPPPPPPPVTDPGSYIIPANGPITSPFGRRWGRAHTGADIDAPTGSAVVAAQAGRVVQAGSNKAYGLSVTIDHGQGIRTLYAHLSRVAVGVGQELGQGTYLGAVGATGRVTGAHLHYEVIVNGVPRNPAPYL